MNPNMSYHAVRTKIITKKGRFLNKNTWNNILKCNSVEQLKNYLLNNVEFQRLLNDVRNVNTNRDSLEGILRKIKNMEIIDLLHYFSGDYKDFLKTILIEDELADLNLILRKIARDETLEDIEKRFVHSDEFTNLPFNDLLVSKDVVQFIESLRDTPYYMELKNLTKEDAVKREFHIEMKLYVIFYKTLLAKAEKLDKEDKEVVIEIIGYKIDLLNIQWIYRALSYYKITPEEILIYSLEGGKSINFKTLKKLCYSKSLVDFRQLVNKTLKYKYFNDYITDEGRTMDFYLFEYLNKKSNKNIGIAISFIYMLNIIINDLTTIIEGIKYNMPKEKLESYLVYKVK